MCIRDSLYIYDDLGVSQRWANKFSEAGIETVADLLGHTEEDLPVSYTHLDVYKRQIRR